MINKDSVADWFLLQKVDLSKTPFEEVNGEGDGGHIAVITFNSEISCNSME